jgi:hypothetical protein
MIHLLPAYLSLALKAKHANYANLKFHSQAQDIFLTNISQRVSPAGEFIYEAPFHFLISRVLAKPDPYSPQQCLQLPPSLEHGNPVIDESTGKRFAQPNIAYYLRATVSIKAGGEEEDSSSKTLESSLPVTVTPYTEEFPPTETKDFPFEFKEQESKALRRSLTGTSLGVMKLSMHEPPALTYNLGCTCSSTVCTEAHLKLEFEPASSCDAHQSLQGLSFMIRPLIRIKTFYSVKSFPKLPSQSMMSLRGTLRLRDEVLKLETRTNLHASWGYTFDLGSSTEDTGPELTSQMVTSGGEPVDRETLQGQQQPSTTGPPTGRWTTILGLPINVDNRLLPTFCSSIVARLYTVQLRIKVKGVRQEHFKLEVPLQVIHSSLDRHQSATAEPVREDQRFPEFRRASAASCFSEESMVMRSYSLL